KEECFLAAYEATVDDLMGRMKDAARAQPTWQARLSAALGALLDFLDREPTIGVAVLVEVHAAGPRAARRRIDVMRRLATLVGPADDGGDGRSTVTADGVVGGVDSASRRRLPDQTGCGGTGPLPELTYLTVL